MESSTVDQNKKVVKEYFAGILTDPPGTVIEYLADDATWWMAGSLPVSGEYTKQEFVEIAKQILSRYGSLELTVTAMTAEGDQVAAEVAARGLFDNVTPYKNDFHILFVFEGGKIKRMKEYCDTQLVQALFFDA